MSRAILVGAIATLHAVLMLCGAVMSPEATPQAPGDKEPAAKDVFGESKVWALHLEISAKEYEAMQPPAGGGFGPPKAPKDKRPGESNLFGTVFPWAQGDLA